MKQPKTIAVDFDATVHSYESGWTGVVPADPPVHGARAGLAALRALGYRVVLFSCRALTHAGRVAIEGWLETHGIEVDEVTAIKPHALLYVDDRAHRFCGDWENVVMLARDMPRPWTQLGQKAYPERLSPDPTCGTCGVPVTEVCPLGRYRECRHMAFGEDPTEELERLRAVLVDVADFLHGERTPLAQRVREALR